MAGMEPGHDSERALSAAPSGAPEAPGQETASDRASLVAFFCSACGSALRAPASACGQVLTCPYCLRETPVPRQPLTSGRSPYPASLFERQRILSLTMRFLCPWCDSKLAADARAGGARADCPQCGKEVRVPVLAGLLPPLAEEDRAGSTAGPPAAPPGSAGAPGGAGVLSAAEVRFLTAAAQGSADA